MYFILQNIFQSLHTSCSVVHIKSTANIQIIKSLLQSDTIVKNTFKNFYLTILMEYGSMTVKTKFKQTKVTPIHHFFVHFNSPLLVLFSFVTFCATVILHLRPFKIS